MCGSLVVSFHSVRKMCNGSGKYVCGILAMCEGFFILCTWVTCTGMYMWAHVILLPVYTWVSCSSRPGIYGEACVHYGCWPVDTFDPLPFSGCKTLLLGVLYVKAVYVCACDVPYILYM